MPRSISVPLLTNWQLGTLWSVNTAYSFRAPRGMLDRAGRVSAHEPGWVQSKRRGYHGMASDGSAPVAATPRAAGTWLGSAPH